MHLRSPLVAVALGAFFSTSCTHQERPANHSGPGAMCTTIGCQDGLQIELATTSKWPKGSYRIEVEGDGGRQTCEVELPLKSCESGASARCEGADLVRVGESGCALPPAEHSLSELSFPSNPARLHVRILQGENLLADESLTPSYGRHQPNGPNCEPTCKSARATITLRAFAASATK